MSEYDPAYTQAQKILEGPLSDQKTLARMTRKMPPFPFVRMDKSEKRMVESSGELYDVSVKIMGLTPGEMIDTAFNLLCYTPDHVVAVLLVLYDHEALSDEAFSNMMRPLREPDHEDKLKTRAAQSVFGSATEGLSTFDGEPEDFDPNDYASMLWEHRELEDRVRDEIAGMTFDDYLEQAKFAKLNFK